jgi:squalene-associated FAD-dependent desaturase
VPSKVHIIGAGLAGLAAAVRLAGTGQDVTVYEAAAHAGGRCRSFHDAVLDRDIDNGNHLILSGNQAALGFLRAVGAEDRLTGPATAEFPFMDLETGDKWCVRPSGGRIPWWVLNSKQRVPGTRAIDYLRAASLAFASPEKTVAACLEAAPTLYRRFWEPLAVAVLNTPAEKASAALLWPVLRQTVALGEPYCRPRIATQGLSHCFVEPALAYLRSRNVDVRFGVRVRSLEVSAEKVVGFHTSEGEFIDVGPGSKIALAVPPSSAVKLVPGLVAPDENQAIVNAHYRLSAPMSGMSIIGLVGGTAHWVFVRGDVASVTVSAANDLAVQQNDAIAAEIWGDVAQALDLPPGPMPQNRVIKEKRATFSQTPSQVVRRPKTQTAFVNLWLAGDWTDTGLPATIEGSVHSGNTAADAVLTS